MLRFIGTMILLASAFGLGYYAGQRPVGELEQRVGELKQTIVNLSRKAADLSKSAVDTTISLERNLRWHESLVDAKEKLIEAKSELLDRNFGSAAKELAATEEFLGKAQKAGESEGRSEKLKLLIEKVRRARADLASGGGLTKAKLEEIQKELDTLIGH